MAPKLSAVERDTKRVTDRKPDFFQRTNLKLAIECHLFLYVMLIPFGQHILESVAQAYEWPILEHIARILGGA